MAFSVEKGFFLVVEGGVLLADADERGDNEEMFVDPVADRQGELQEWKGFGNDGSVGNGGQGSKRVITLDDVAAEGD